MFHSLHRACFQGYKDWSGFSVFWIVGFARCHPSEGALTHKQVSCSGAWRQERYPEVALTAAASAPLLPIRRLLFLKLTAQNEREKFAFCSVKGCERIRVKALIPKNAGISDCAATAYPRFAERATVDVPMPRKLVGAQLVSGRRRARPFAFSGAQTQPGSSGDTC